MTLTFDEFYFGAEIGTEAEADRKVRCQSKPARKMAYNAWKREWRRRRAGVSQ